MSNQTQVDLSVSGVPVLACNLNVLTAEQRPQHLNRQQTLFAQVVDYRELPMGYQFDFPVELLAQVVEFVSLERQCCPFFQFTIDVAPSSEVVSFSLSGDAHVKIFLASNLAEIIQNSAISI